MGKFSVQVIVFLQVTCYAYILGLTGKLWLRSGSHRGSFKQTLSTVIDTDTASTKNIIVKSTDAAMIASPGVYARVSTDRWWGELFCAHRNHGIRWFVPLWTVEQYGGNVLPHFQVLKTQSRSSYDIDSGLSRVRHRFNLTDAEYNLWQVHYMVWVVHEKFDVLIEHFIFYIGRAWRDAVDDVNSGKVREFYSNAHIHRTKGGLPHR